MEARTLLRLSAVAAIAGGLFRATDPLLGPLHLANPTLQQIWFVIDALLLCGVTGIYLANRETGLGGFTGFAVFVIGILLVRSAGVAFWGFGGYETGATVALIGVALLALSLLLKRTQLAAASLWLASLAAGLASRTGIGATAFVALSGVLFGLGFAAAGASLLMRPRDAHLVAAAAR
jgi:hypothetical protein